MEAFVVALVPFLLVAAVFLVVWQIARHYERRRTDAFRQVADDLGFHFEGAESALAARFNSLRLFSQGHTKKVSNLMRGSGQNAEVCIFDYSYTVGSGKNKNTYRQTAVCLESPDLQIPDFELRPEHFFHRIGSMFGYQDIDFADYPEFSRKYLLRGTSEAAIRRVFDVDVVARIESLDGVSIEGDANRLVFYRHAKRGRPEELRRLLEEAFGVFTVLRQTRSETEPVSVMEAVDVERLHEVGI
jgi:hypothetical protein